MPIFALPVVLLFMNPHGCSNLLNAIGMGNIWVVTFAFFSLRWAFAPGRIAFSGSVLLAALSASCFANGLLVAPAAVVGLMLNRQFRRAAVLGCVTLLLWMFYLHAYQHSLASLDLLELLEKAAVMTGGSAVFARVPRGTALIVGGLILLLALAVLLRRRSWREMPFYTAFLLFLVLSVLMASRGRLGWDTGYMLQDRYRMYGLMMVATGYLMFVEICPARFRRQLIPAIGIAGIFCLLSYATFTTTAFSEKRWREATAMNWQLGRCFPNIDTAGWEAACGAMKRAAATDVYRLPVLLSSNELSAIAGLSPDSADRRIDVILKPESAFSGYALVPAPTTDGYLPATPDFAVLRTPAELVILPVGLMRLPLQENFLHGLFVSRRFCLVLPGKASIPGHQLLFALAHSPTGSLLDLWEAQVDCP
jgi:hypothetical protein